jgi:hypothetical protein
LGDLGEAAPALKGLRERERGISTQQQQQQHFQCRSKTTQQHIDEALPTISPRPAPP